jgi:hypothetical protein
MVWVTEENIAEARENWLRHRNLAHAFGKEGQVRFGKSQYRMAMGFYREYKDLQHQYVATRGRGYV